MAQKFAPRTLGVAAGAHAGERLPAPVDRALQAHLGPGHPGPGVEGGDLESHDRVRRMVHRDVWQTPAGRLW